MACFSFFSRIRCNRRVNDESDAAMDDILDGESQQRRNSSQRRSQNPRVRHQAILEQLNSLIPVLKYSQNNKDIDEFNAADCVICMEPFVAGSKVRKIPTCKHLFHD